MLKGSEVNWMLKQNGHLKGFANFTPKICKLKKGSWLWGGTKRKSGLHYF